MSAESSQVDRPRLPVPARFAVRLYLMQLATMPNTLEYDAILTGTVLDAAETSLGSVTLIAYASPRAKGATRYAVDVDLAAGDKDVVSIADGEAARSEFARAKVELEGC